MMKEASNITVPVLDKVDAWLRTFVDTGIEKNGASFLDGAWLKSL